MTLTEAQLDNLSVAFEEMPRMLEAYDDGRAEGRREMLWLVAVGAEMERWRSQCSEGSFAECWYWWVRDSALRALANLGDEQAREMLR